MATILDVCGLELPKTYRGVEQYPLSGVSMRYSQEYKAPGTFKGGTILAVGVSIGKQQYLDLEKTAAALFAVE